MKFNMPQSLKLEHEELHAELTRATQVSGKIGDSAKAVAKILHPHFIKEEEYAIPPPGLLSLLADGKVTTEMRDVLTMTERLKSELPEMLKEHTAIVAHSSLSLMHQKKKKMEYMHFADKLILHARNEEEILYPASILVGEY